jgi:predicted Zn finger-like uncharacterized protein
MTVHCPHCLTGYELPRALMGDHGARVRCPGCQGVFVVLPEKDRAGEAVDPRVEARPSAAPHRALAGTGAAAATATTTAPGEPPSVPRYEPAVVAGAVLDVMIDFLGDALRRSRERGTVLSDHGPAIVAVWEEYRRRAGSEAPAATFRAALLERCGVDLTPRQGG